MQLSHSEITALWSSEKKKNRRHLLIGMLLLTVVFLVSMCFRTVKPGFIPKETVVNAVMAIRMVIAELTHSSLVYQKVDIQNELPYYLETIARFKISLITVFSGMALALSGAVFQTVYHNPLASPNMIGATVGVNLGNLAMVAVYSVTCLNMIIERYVVCYVFTIVIMGFIILFSKFAGLKGYAYSVVEMVMVGSVISHILSTFVTFRMYRMNTNDLATYQLLNMGTYIASSWKGILIFLVLTIGGTIPLLRMRFRINSLGISQEEAAASGIYPWREQVLAQIFSIVIITAALVQCGDIGLFALAVPHIVRYYAGADFRKLAVFSCLAGGILLLVCRSISSMFFVSVYGAPISFIIALLMLPVFIVVIVQQRRGFE